ncbi:dienelactone hydrolase family protein [Novosphingobium sp. HII-3]|uniref:dienelactone hydrolase family protein n=1 Tax=Novosphingobium TaxID=165696 RepID=UPI000CDB66F7|nr:dienelactone hydrolase family protein [Novosphingobium sp. HII-3]
MMTDARAFDYSHDGATFKGQLAVPEGSGPHPAILVMHNARGLGLGPIKRAQALAKEGYVALASDLYGDGAFYHDPRQANASLAPLFHEPARLRAKIVAAFETLRGLPQVDAERVGAIGFCFGGMCALELARSGAPARGVVSFHGLLNTHARAKAGEVQAKLLILTGERDPYAPSSDVEALRDELRHAGADHHITIYSEGWHAFSDDEAAEMEQVPGVRYDPLIDRLAWAQTLAFLEATVKENV